MSEVTETENTQEIDATVVSQTAQVEMIEKSKVNDIVQSRIARAEKKVRDEYEGVDVDLYNQLVTEKQDAKQVLLKEQGKFDELLNETVAPLQNQISALKEQIRVEKVDMSIMGMASNMNAINPEQVVQLLQNQVKFTDGNIEVIDLNTGNQRYNNDAQKYTVNELVNEFLTNNPHFVKASIAGSGTSSNTEVSGIEKVDWTKADMLDPIVRQQYKDFKRT